MGFTIPRKFAKAKKAVANHLEKLLEINYYQFRNFSEIYEINIIVLREGLKKKIKKNWNVPIGVGRWVPQGIIFQFKKNLKKSLN